MTQLPPLSPDEPTRLEALRACKIVETPLEERFERITRMAQRALGVEIVAISLLEADRQWFKSIQGLDVDGTSRDVSFCGHTILQDDVMVVEDACQDDRFMGNPLVTGEPNIRFYAGCQVRSVDGSTLGTLCAIDSSPRTLSPDDLRTLQDLAQMVESELRTAASNAVQADLLEEMDVEKRKALVDPLTRVWSREGVLTIAEETMARVAEGSEGAALVMVDLDRFKAINDTHGHAAGDEVLRIAARRMLGSVREGDIVGRLSGDEFLLVLDPCADALSAEQVTQRVRDRIVGSPIVWKGEPIAVTASFGVRFIPPKAIASLADMMEHADGALYESKDSGRDRVCSFRDAA